MSVPNLILMYLVGALAALAGLVVYAEMRRRRFEPGPTNDRIFRCEKCGCVYTDDPDVDRSRCAQCGHINEPMQF